MSSNQEYHSFQELFQTFENRSSVPAILAPDRTPLSYGNLCRQINYTVSFLNRHGLGRNDRIGTILPDSPEQAALFFSIIAGATFVPINPDSPDFREQEFSSSIPKLKIDALIIQDGFSSSLIETALEIGISLIVLSPLTDSEAGLYTLEWKSGDNQRECLAGLSQPEDIAIVLETSGSTSEPKIVPLTQSNILASAGYIVSSLNLADTDRCLNVMPMHHIAGLISPVLASIAAGGSVVCTGGFSTEVFHDWLVKYKPTWYSAVPTVHQAIIEKAKAQSSNLKNTSLRFVRSASFTLFEKLFIELEKTFDLPVVQTYGMTEALPIASTPLSPYKRKPMAVGIPVSEVAVIDGSRKIPGKGSGEIIVRGPQVFKGYENNPEANREAFLNGWLRTGDIGYFDDDGYLYITGRIKDTINRGGQKVSPYEVEAVLMSHPAVCEAAVFGIRHLSLGETAAAMVTLNNNAVTEGELRQYCADRLPVFKTPQHIFIVDSIPRSPAGKITRTILPEEVEKLLKSDYIPPSTETEAVLTKLWQDILKRDLIGRNDNFFALGGDSLMAAQLAARLQNESGMDITVRNIFDYPTLKEFAVFLSGEQNE